MAHRAVIASVGPDIREALGYLEVFGNSPGCHAVVDDRSVSSLM